MGRRGCGNAWALGEARAKLELAIDDIALGIAEISWLMSRSSQT